MKSISVIIPIRDREVWRIKRVAKQFSSEVFKEVIIVDYNSSKPISVKGKNIKVIRYDKDGAWNKAHAINLGYKNSSGDFILTVDCDIILEPNFEEKLILDENSYCYSGDVRRVPKDKVSDDFVYMLNINSSPWINVTNYAREMYGLANGGLQLYPSRLLEYWNGIDENLVYSGGMDNITNLMAKKLGMNIIQLPIKLLHIEHDSKKHENFPKEERDLAFFLASRRGDYLNNWIKSPVVNEYCGRMSGPCYTTYKEELRIFNENKKTINNKIKKVNKRDSKIMIAVINNKNYLPQSFVRSLLSLYNRTISEFPNVTIRFIKACQVNHMRNIAIKVAIKEDYDYLIQLDDDHNYDDDTIIKLIARDKDFVTVPTKQRVAPFLPTQYFRIKNPMKQDGNYVFIGNQDNLIKIEASGPVAMLMKVSALKKLDFPYYYMDYSYGFENTMGGDFVFCKQVKDKGFNIYLDPTINCPHFVKGIVSSGGVDAEIHLDDGTL